MLRQMAVELQADTADLSSNLRADAASSAARDSVIEWLRGVRPFDSTTESRFARALQFTNFIADSSAYDNLKSVGVDLIRDDSLRLEITRYYESGYGLVSATQETFVDQPWSRELQPRMAKHFDVAFWIRVGSPSSVQALRADAGLRTSLASFNEMVGFADRASTRALRQAEALLDHIDDYLAKR